MKYALLLCLLPFFAHAQDRVEKKLSRFSIGIESGIVTTYMNVRDYDWYHELCCHGYEDDDLDSAPTSAIHSNLTLNYRFKQKHKVGLGFQFSQFGENHDAGAPSREVLNYIGFIGSYEFSILMGRKAAIGLYNAFCFDIPAFKDKRDYYSSGISHIVGLVWRFKVGNALELSINGIVKNALSEYNAIAWFNDNRRVGKGLLIGISYRI